VVCPLIDKADKDSAVANIASVEDTLKAYEAYFAPKGYKIACITGKTEKETSDAIIKDFKDNKYQILIATTIIEVGVNVPNASLIFISNAERFGLSALHQLRGRVGRGQYQSYCILKSEDKENERLNVLCQTNDGFKIAEADLAMRKTGDLLGTKQSGKDKYVELMLTYPNMFEKIRELSKLMCDNGTAETVIEVKENITEQREESE
jgi:ATP-dependent DNA helicase RecG